MIRRTALTLALAAIATPLAAQQKAVIENGMTQVVPAFADTSTWIRHNLWVETDLDTDRDGRKDRVHVDVTRPGQTESEGLKVPVIYQSSPYFAGVARTFAFWNINQELGAEPEARGAMQGAEYQPERTRISNALVNQWVPRGYAVVHSEATGTGRSLGCPTIGDTPERMAMKYVIDWLNGRAKAYTTPTGSVEVRAPWSTGKVGMIGTSYEGTLPLAAATTSVEGLEVVIPVAPNTSYYHYYRANGLVRSPGGYPGEDVDVLYDFVASGDPAKRAVCDSIYKAGAFAAKDRRTGDYNDFWASRDLLPHVKDIKAAVLLAHGLNDWNVMPSHSVRIYEEMKRLGKPVSLYLHQGGHGGDPPFDMQNRWFTHYLYGADNGVQNDPPVWVVSNTASDSVMALARTLPPAERRRLRMPPPVPQASWPAPKSEMVTLHPTGDGNGIGSLSTATARKIDTLADNPAMSANALASAPASQGRLLYATATLTDSIRISGSVRVTLRVAVDRPAANLSVYLVTLPFDSTKIGSEGRIGVVSRGWADPQNHASLTRGGNFDSKAKGEPLVPGRFYDVTFDLEPDEQVITAGKQLGLMIMSTDPEFTLIPKGGAQLIVDAARTSIAVPVVGGLDALTRAGFMRQVP